MSPTKQGQLTPPKVLRYRKHPSRRHWPTLVSCISVCAAIILLAVTANVTLPWFPHAGSSTDPETPDLRQVRMGTVVVEEDGNECERMKFDNDTGRTVDATGNCHSTVVLDSHGVPVPMGTLHRLDSIRKSFQSGAN